MPSPLDYTRRLWLRLWLLAVLVFLYAPIVILVAFSFNDSRRNIVWQGLTTDYYVAAWNNATLIEAFGNSLVIAVLCTTISTLLGALAALALWRFRFPGRAAFDGVMTLPIVIPEICMGVALMVFFGRIGWPTGLPWPMSLSPIVIGHVAFSFPFVAVVVRARLASFDRSLEEASRDLGASEWQTFWGVTVPYLKPALIAGALLAMTLSLDDFVITFFTSRPETVTFPVLIYSMVRFGATPEVNAASTVLIAVTLVLTALAVRLQAPPKGEEVVR
jgi:spermidine/putrescine transport system permease protein